MEPEWTAEPAAEPVHAMCPATEPPVAAEPVAEPVHATGPGTEPVCTAEPAAAPCQATAPETDPAPPAAPAFALISTASWLTCWPAGAVRFIVTALPEVAVVEFCFQAWPV